MCPPQGSFSNAVVLNGDVEISVIIRDSYRNHFLLTGSVDLTEAIALYEGLSKALETSLSLLWVEIDPLVWNIIGWQNAIC